MEQDVDFEQRRQEYLQRLRGLRLMDDDFMTKVFEDKACAELLLQIILQRDDLTVQQTQTQYEIKNLQSRSVRLDIVAVDEIGQIYNIEIQRSDKGAGMKRARYNSSLLDANVTDPGEDLQSLAETYVIFITERDVLKGGLPIYHINRKIEELNNAAFGDGAHIIYVNSQIRDETALGRLMHDFFCTSAEEMHYPILADRVRYFKEDVKGVETMCRSLEDMCDQAAQRAVRANSCQVALRMLAAGELTYEKIADYSGLTVAEVEALAEKQSA